jgi:sporulation protein YlmC with PRC-barrel domain
MSQTRTTDTELEKLRDTGLELADAAQDIRNYKVLDTDGEDIGHVSALFIDRDERKVRMLEVRGGGFLGLGDRHFLLPVDTITNVEKREVHINQTRARIVQSPVYDPTLVEAPTHDYWEPYYGYYGLSPYWGSGYMYPQFPISSLPRRNAHSDYKGD